VYEVGLRDYILGSLNNITNATSDADLEAYAREHSTPNGHVVGSASMSPRGADYGVVDPDLLVKGVQHLRIVDASILVTMNDLVFSLLTQVASPMFLREILKPRFIL
jgi:choline dehydrogenase-like flavoprotein